MPSATKRRAPLRVNHSTYARMFALLLEGPCTNAELAEQTGMHIKTVQGVTRALRQHQVVHVNGWEKDLFGRDCIPIFKFGRGTDKPRTKQPAAVLRERTRQRKLQRHVSHALAGRPMTQQAAR